MPYHLDLHLAIPGATAKQPELCRSTQVGLLLLLLEFQQEREAPCAVSVLCPSDKSMKCSANVNVQ